MAEISCGVYCLPSMSTRGVSLSPYLLYICQFRGFGAYLRKTVAHKSFDGCHGPSLVGDRLTFGGSPTLRSPLSKMLPQMGWFFFPLHWVLLPGHCPPSRLRMSWWFPGSIPIIFPIVFVLVFCFFLLSIDVPCRFMLFIVFLLKSCQ